MNGPPLLDLSRGPIHTIDTTQRLALEKASNGAPEGTVVWARQMTGGRGRGTHTWEAPRDLGLWISFVLRPRLEMAAWPALTPLLALCVAEAAESLPRFTDASGPAPGTLGIKWPNDVMGVRGKVAGILAEACGGAVVCGVGINLAQQPRDFPAEIRPRASSLLMEGICRDAGTPITPAEMAEVLNDRLTASYEHFQNGDREFLREGLHRRATLLGAEVTIDDEGARLDGRVIDIGPLGQLVLESGGARREVHSGTVARIRRS